MAREAKATRSAEDQPTATATECTFDTFETIHPYTSGTYNFLPSSSRLTFISLPAEVHLEIFKNLESTDAVCLGLTNKVSWEIRNLHVTNIRLFPIRLCVRSSLLGSCFEVPYDDLAERLETWMQPRVLFTPLVSLFPYFVATEERRKYLEQQEHQSRNLWLCQRRVRKEL